jgi:hypothetical protein
MNLRFVRYAIAACAGLAAPFLWVAARSTLATLRRPNARIASFLDPTRPHRDLVATSLDIALGVVLGIALGAIVARVTRPKVWRGWCAFIVAFLACNALMILLRGEHARVFAILSQPVFASFVVATLLGCWLGSPSTSRGAR